MSISLRDTELTVGQTIAEKLCGAALDFSPLLTKPVPCTITKVLKDWVLVFGGKSSKTFVQICLFRAELITGFVPDKGIQCSLTPSYGQTPMAMRLWHGGLMPGGALFQFMLVDVNYSA